MNKLVLNFGHMLSDRSVKFLQERLGDFTYIHHRLRINFHVSLASQVARAVDEIETRLWSLNGEYLERMVIFATSPGLSDPAALMMVELFGRTGTFPNLLLMRREAGEFVIYDVLDGEHVKLDARGKRRVQMLESPCKGNATMNTQ